jgi:AraC-like DNA-binding protein
MPGRVTVSAMSGRNERASPVFLSTSEVDEAEAFDFWRDVICSTFVKLLADPVSEAFAGSVDHVAVGDLELTAVVAGGQDVRRTRSLISGSSEEFVLASIQVSGLGRIEQDGRVAELEPGALAFYDSTRPYRLYFAGPFEQLVIQVPKRALVAASGLSADLRDVTARRVAGPGCGQVVGSFFRSLAKARHSDDSGSTDVLQPQAMSLLGAAAAWASGRRHAGLDATELNRRRVAEHVARRFSDAALDVGTIARECDMSRRTVFRALEAEEGGLGSLLRRTRVEHAKVLLLNNPHRPIAAVAAACGFGSEASFYRAFRQLCGVTPAEFRERASEPGTG